MPDGAASRALRLGAAATFAAAAGALAWASAWAATSSAEYSMRWDPSSGGPASAAQALAQLGMHGGKGSRYEVQYFDIGAAVDAPSGFEAILRKRHNDTQAQLTYKLRGTAPWPGGTSLKQWHCPLPMPQQRKEEADVAFLTADRVSSAHSRSCSHSSAQLDVAMPAELKARPLGCKSTMTRRESGALKVEEWHMADGSRLLEVSRLADHSAKASAAFRDQVVKPLLAAGVMPLQRSKSMIGGACTK